MDRGTVYDAERIMRRNVYSVGGFVAIAVVLGFFLFFLQADFTWSMFMMIGLICVIIIAVTMSYAPKATLLAIIFLKPAIDQLWWFKAFGGLNFQAVVGAIIPIMAFAFLFLTRNEFFLRAPMCIWIRRMCLLTFITMYMNGFRTVALAEEFRIISGPALFFLTGWLFTESEDMKRLSKAVIWSSAWIFLGIWISYLIGKEHFSFDTFGTNPLEGMYYHKQDLARVATMMCVFSLCFVKMTESKTARFLCYSISLAMVLIVFSSYTRMSWIAIYLCICFWFIWIGKWKQVVILAPVVLILSWGTLDQSFQKAHFDLSNPNLADPKSVSGRGDIWKAQIEGFQNMSIAEQLLGGGYNRSIGLSAEYSESKTARNAHSCIPLMMVENGIIFTIIYNVILLMLCRDAFSLRKTGDPNLQILGALFFVGAAYFYVSGITTNSHTYPSLTWYVWGLGGIIYRIKHFPTKADEAPKEHRFFSRSFAPVRLVRPQS